MEDYSYFYNLRDIIIATEAKLISDFVGRSAKYSEEKTMLLFLDSMDEDSQINADAVEEQPYPITILFTPKENLRKVTALLHFKNYLKEWEEKINNGLFSDNEQRVLFGIIHLYPMHTNEMLMNVTKTAFSLEEKFYIAGDNAITLEKQDILTITRGLENPKKNIFRFDLLHYGATVEI